MLWKEEIISQLNDLIRVNHDRITWYEKAAMASREFSVDLKNIFHHMASESRKHTRALSMEVINLDGQPSAGKTLAGRLYLLWTDLISGIRGIDRVGLLNSSLAIEEAAKKTYVSALNKNLEFPKEIYQKIQLQLQSLINSSDLILRYRQRLAANK